MIQLNYRDAKPIYEQIKDGLRKLVISNSLMANEKLPSVRELASKLAINPNTIQKAYKELEMENVCFTRRGMGTFVTQDPEKVKAMKREMAGALIYEFLNGMKQLGFSQEEAIHILEQSEYKEK